MKSLISILILFFAICSVGYGQDLVVTSNGDSLNVEIIKVEAEHLHFIQFEPRKRKVVMPKSEIKLFQYIFYSTSRTQNLFFDPNQTRFKVGISGGFSVALDGADDDASQFFKDYVRRVNSGWHFKGEVDYYLQNRLGFGVIYDRYFTKGFEPEVLFIDQTDGDTLVGVLSDNIAINFIGPQVSYNLNTNKENYTVFLAFGAGPMFYKDKLKRVDPFVAKGVTLGTHLAAGIDFVLMDYVMMGFEISGTIGTLREYKWKDGNETTTIIDQQDISRLNISLGLRFFK